MNKLKTNQLALYLGCPCYVYSTLTNRWRKDVIDIPMIKSNMEKGGSYSYSDIKPVLRPITTMTDDEFCAMFNNGGKMVNYRGKMDSLWKLHTIIASYGDFDTIEKLLAMGFDIFWWIEKDLALDSSFAYTSSLRRV